MKEEIDLDALLKAVPVIEKDESTKWKIFETAIYMFAEEGLERSSLRIMAKKVGVKHAAIYAHFTCKDDILVHIYKFYIYYYEKVLPNIDELLKGAEKEDVYDLLKKTDVRFEAGIEDLMSRILIILSRERRTDKRCECIITEYFYGRIEKTFKPLLSKLVDIGRIEPINIEAFIALYYNFAYGMSLRNYSEEPGNCSWEKCIKMLYSLIKPIENKNISK